MTLALLLVVVALLLLVVVLTVAVHVCDVLCPGDALGPFLLYDIPDTVCEKMGQIGVSTQVRNKFVRKTVGLVMPNKDRKKVLTSNAVHFYIPNSR